MNNWRKLMTISLLFAAFVPASAQQQEAFKAKELLQKDLNAYTGGDLILSVGEITIAPGASGSRHRHPGPTLKARLKSCLRERQRRPITREKHFMKTRASFTFQQKT